MNENNGDGSTSNYRDVPTPGGPTMSSIYEGNEPVKSDKFAFLFSPRFWQLALVGISVGLNFPFPNNPWVQGFSAMIGVWLGGSVVVGSVGKFSEAIGGETK